MGTRFLVSYEGPIEEFVATVNGEYIIFHQIKMKGKTDKVGEVYSQNAFNFILRNMNITPYSPCPEALKQLNKIQKARIKSLEEARVNDVKKRLEHQISVINVKVDQKQEQIEEAKKTIFIITNEIEDAVALIPKITEQIKNLFK